MTHAGTIAPPDKNEPENDAPKEREPGHLEPDKAESDKAKSDKAKSDQAKAEKDEQDLAWANLQTVLSDETAHLDGLRAAQQPPLGASAKRVGLALSGGGIRSATFSLGVIQALAERRLIANF